MTIVRDLKNRDSKRLLRLDKEGSIKPAIKSPYVLNLSKKEGSTKQKSGDIVPHKRTREKYQFLYKVEEDENHPQKNYTELLRFVVGSLIVVFILNLFQIGYKFFGIANNVEVEAFQGYQQLVSGGQDALEANFGGAVQFFESASHSFEKAKQEIWFLGSDGILTSKQSFGDSAYTLLESGEHISNAASFFSQGISEIQEIPGVFLENNTKLDEELEAPTISLTEKLKSALSLFENAFDEVKIADRKIQRSGKLILPSNLQKNYENLTANLSDLTNLIDRLKRHIPALLKLFGDRYPHRYLILFQNNTESRPTGGFIGSYMIVDINDGHITKADFHDIYETDGQLTEFIESPEDIAELSENWRMRDSNYSPDFAVSAAKAAWFLEKEEGPGVDSVIAVNQSLLKDFLSLTGPLEVEGLSADLTAENYNTVLTYIVESKFEGEENPKAIIGELVPILQENLFKDTSAKSLFAVIQKGIEEKQILAWSKDHQIKQFWSDIDMDGAVKLTNESEDYLNIITINIGGNKSDQYINSEIIHDTMITGNGSVKNVLHYTRKHTWSPDVLLDWKKQLEPFGFTNIPEGIQTILGKGNNRSLVKIFVPSGSELHETIGVEFENVNVGYDEELDKTFFSFISEISAQNEQKVTLKYTIPQKLQVDPIDTYSLTVQKQPGALKDVKLTKRIISDPRITNYRNFPEEFVHNENEIIEYVTTLNTDQYFSSLWGVE